ncbi:hypothetical protein JCGZ_05094 [Jatropha curcas]|uniref:Uncharacterized protein n=1 Tax=Jatropha curcas TaxID=180498 RepID=A0A067LF93_JATCU|nr:hypothetical protein JCGZ_05094 [Jatropha curcas]
MASKLMLPCLCKHLARLHQASHTTIVVRGLVTRLAIGFNVFKDGYAKCPIGNIKKEKFTMSSLINMKLITRLEEYFYFMDKNGSVEGDHIAIVVEEVSDVATEMSEEEDESDEATEEEASDDEITMQCAMSQPPIDLREDEDHIEELPIGTVQTVPIMQKDVPLVTSSYDNKWPA